jgi:hypothetical protein
LYRKGSSSSSISSTCLTRCQRLCCSSWKTKENKVDLLQHEINYRAQREKQILKEIEELHKAVKLREELVTAERAKEKEIARKNLAQNEQVIDQQNK